MGLMPWQSTLSPMIMFIGLFRAIVKQSDQSLTNTIINDEPFQELAGNFLLFIFNTPSNKNILSQLEFFLKKSGFLPIKKDFSYAQNIKI